MFIAQPPEIDIDYCSYLKKPNKSTYLTAQRPPFCSEIEEMFARSLVLEYFFQNNNSLFFQNNDIFLYLSEYKEKAIKDIVRVNVNGLLRQGRNEKRFLSQGGLICSQFHERTKTGIITHWYAGRKMNVVNFDKMLKKQIQKKYKELQEIELTESQIEILFTRLQKSEKYLFIITQTKILEKMQKFLQYDVLLYE